MTRWTHHDAGVREIIARETAALTAENEGLRARLARVEALDEANADRPYCIRCEAPIFLDAGVWKREATGVAQCPRNPANDGHEPRDPVSDGGVPMSGQEHSHPTGGAWHTTYWKVPGCSACTPEPVDVGAREALAEVIASRSDRPRPPFPHELLVADLILASDWLAARDATVAAHAKAEALREAADEVQAVYDLQCPPQRSHFADDDSGRGAHCAHMWWSTVLGGTLQRLRDRATESGRP